LQEPSNGFDRYGKVQQWLSESLGIDAQYHGVYQMTRYRLKAKLKVARPEPIKQNREQEDGDLLVVIAPPKAQDLVKDYALRWGMETLFGIFKTRGFCLESTH
jgi:hypothetical protein